MEYDALLLPRMMMRMYSLISLDEAGRPTASLCPELWAAYTAIEPQINAAFQQRGIRPVAVSVISDFNGEIKNAIELVFCVVEPALTVPAEIYAAFGAYGKPNFDAPPQPPVVRLGYTGRYFDYRSKIKLVTDGLQIGEKNKIVLDMFSLKKMTLDGISCRLTHELLHVFGVAEEEMAAYKRDAYFELKNKIEPFSTSLALAASTAEADFSAAARDIATAHPKWVQSLISFGNRLHLEGFPADPATVLTAEVTLPEKSLSRGSVVWGRHEVLFM